MTFGHATPLEVRQALGVAHAEEESDWLPKLRQRLEHYAAGRRVDLHRRVPGGERENGHAIERPAGGHDPARAQ